MDWIKWIIQTWGRSLAGKYVLRFILWGGTALSAKLAIEAPSDDTSAKVADWFAAVLCACLALLVDWLHHQADHAQAAEAAEKGLSDPALTEKTRADAEALRKTLGG